MSKITIIDTLHEEPKEFIKCDQCKVYSTPFYFGDKPKDRAVMNDCPSCGNMIDFVPDRLKTKPYSVYLKMRADDKWVLNSSEINYNEHTLKLREEYPEEKTDLDRIFKSMTKISNHG